MKSFFTFLSSILVTGLLPAQQTAPTNNCFAAFKMGRSAQFPASCNDRGTNIHSPASLQLLGKQIASGFAWHDSPATAGGSYVDVYGQEGSTTKPAGAVFRDCPGRWTYFKVTGVTRNPRRQVSVPITDQYARIRHYGNEANPDSIRFEFSKTFDSQPFTSFEKRMNCDDCWADRTPPKIDCPNPIITYPLNAPTNLDGETVFKEAKIKITDACPLDDVSTYPYRRWTKPGETIRYTTIAYDKAGNRVTCTYKVLFTNTLADSCLPRFRMGGLNPIEGCNAQPNTLLHGAPTFTMLGKQMADGFSWFRHPLTVSGSYDHLYARKGSTVPPTGVVFRNCPAHWTYFKMVGFNQGDRPPNAYEHTNIYARVRYFGNERNPDSIRVEFSDNLSKNYGSFQKDTFCNSCVATDHSAPVIHKCPTETITHVLNSSTVDGSSVFKEAGLSISDNCGVDQFITFPYIQRDVQAGQTVEYKTVAYDAAGNAANPCKFKVLFGKPLADTCLPRFTMAGGQTTTCNEYLGTQRFAAPIFQMLGRSMSDGFAWERPFPPGGGVREVLYARNGTTTVPTGVSFRSCAGNWIYFKVVGFTQSGRGMPTAKETEDVYARVRYFGKERNPDSIRVDFAGNRFSVPNYASVRKDTVCDPCLATDRTPPVIRNCPTEVVSYPLTSASVQSRSIETAAKLETSDSCGSTNSFTFPYFKTDAQIGQTVDYTMQSYDRAGNGATCAFKVKYVQATPNLRISGYSTPNTYTPNAKVVCGFYLANSTLNEMKNVRVTIPLPPNTTLASAPIPSSGTWHETCANGQKCYEWVIPEIAGLAYNNIQIPIFISNTTEPIIVTAKILESTPADGDASDNQASITIRPSNVVPVVPQFVENQSVPIVIGTLSPNPTEGGLQVTLTSNVAQSVDFEVYNAYGQKVHSAAQAVSLGENQLFFDLTKLPAGTYFIQCTDQTVRSEKHTFVKY